VGEKIFLQRRMRGREVKVRNSPNWTEGDSGKSEREEACDLDPPIVVWQWRHNCKGYVREGRKKSPEIIGGAGDKETEGKARH